MNMVRLNVNLKLTKSSLTTRSLQLRCSFFLFLLLSFSSIFGQQLITGRVLSGETALSGVSIKVKGTATASQTDALGNFSIKASPTSTLIFSYVGYTTQEIPVSKRSLIEVTMTASSETLNEVVVTGYTRQARKDITGSVSVVDVNAMKSIPTGASEQALQGQASGVTIISSGAPGGASNIFIRGVSSFGDNQPLIIVDGVQSSLHDLNMNDIESVQILKDAGAASIYGVRGSNGVIIVTTKKGKSGTPVVSLDSYTGYQVPPGGNVLDIASPQAVADFVKKMKPNTQLFANGLPDYMYAGPGVIGVGNVGDPAVDPSKYVFDAANPNNDYLIQKVNKQGTDWFHQVFKPAFTQSHNLNVSGGTDKSNYLFSLGYLNQEGSLIETHLKRYSVRANSEMKIKKNIRIGENIYAFYKQNPSFNNQSQNNAIFFAYTIPAFIPVYDIAGNYGGTWAGPELGNRWNPVAMMKNTANDRANTWNVMGNVYAEVDFLKDFTARTSFGGTIDNQYRYSFSPNRYQDKEQHSGINSYAENSLFNSSWTWTNTVNYRKVFGKHNVKLLAGSEAISNDGRAVGGASAGFFSTDPNYLVLNNGTVNVTNFSNAYANTLYSLFSRLDYAYNNKYLLAATVRRDGSSRFGEEKRYGVFPSFSVGWKVSEESFMEGITWMNNLKLKGSWGKLGSQNNVSPTNAFTLYNSNFGNSYYDINGTGSIRQGFYQTNIGNLNTGWEEDIITNYGFDATLFNKIDVSVERYKKQINGLLFPQPLPATTGGAAAPVINIGDIENKGWDVSATYRGKSGKDFQYNIGVNVTTYQNTITDIPGPGFFDVGIARNQERHPVSAFFGYDVIGFFKDAEDVAKSPTQQAAAPGRFKYRDVDNNGLINVDDRTFIGNPNPDFTYGINLSASYKNFDAAMLLYGSQGNDVFNSLRSQLNKWDDFMGAMGNEMLFNAWSPTNQNAKAPIPENSSNFSKSGSSSFYVEDGSFFKCRSLMLGYTVKPSVLAKAGINKFRLYFQVANLFSIDKYSGLDPELSSAFGSLSSNQQSAAFGIDNSNYPNNFKNFVVGVNLSF